MSDPVTGETTPAAGGEGTTAGALLRQARQARGLHIAALATSIKVTPRKLELLEADRFDELPGATFTRALAQTVCRTLKIDSAPVLALLPSAAGQGLEQMSRGLNEPFRDRPGRSVPTDLAFLKNPVLLGAVALVALATAVYLLPSGWLSQHLPRRSAPPAAAAPGGVVNETVAGSQGEVVSPDAMAAPASSSVYSAPAEPPVDTAPSGEPASSPAPALALTPALASAPVVAAPAASAASGVLQLTASAQSWVEVIDRRGSPVFSRLLQAGETVAVDGASPLRVKIGNARATQVSFKGERIDLAPVTSSGNVARLELK